METEVAAKKEGLLGEKMRDTCRRVDDGSS